ncbi:MAG: UPF0182 family protein, partial [Planctomycetia bacterium]|nr:UPF0182 family protein [Planctomycetia bacterium]
PYYYFSDVDVDRYQIEDKYQSVVLSLRELSPDRIEPKAQTWVGLRMIYTHGYGLCMSPVNEVTQEGNPRLIIRDIPPVAERGMNVTQPAIYFGELTTDYVFVKTHQKEFDYPVGADNKYTTYTGKAGVSISGLMRRLVFAWHLGDKNILFTDQFKADSRILLRRHIRRRAQAIAPFLRYDKDPYPVLVNGRILWILDAYTTTSRYPYSTRTYDESDAGVTNYIRNAVKVVIDAYDGTVTFYISDPEDPIIRTIQAIFPGMFASMATDMPQELRDHIRYPLDLFDIQAHQYAVYHMTDPQVFFTKEDKWSRPQETYGSRGEVDVESYYIIMRLPGEEKAEFLLMLPFVPSTKDNLIGWMAGRCDGADYGKLLVYEFPKEKLLYGPRQVEARIDQNAEISKELTLWGAKEGGSSVIRGNLLVIPIADSIMYVEPLYIQAEKGAIPQLKRIIVAHKDKLVMSKTLDDAIASVFARRLASPMVTKPKVVVPLVPSLKASLSKQAKIALEHYNKAMQHLKEGQWEKFGKEIEALRKALEAIAASDAKTKDSKD